MASRCLDYNEEGFLGSVRENAPSVKCWISEDSVNNGVGGSHDSYCSLKSLWSGMGVVVPARTWPPRHPPSPPTVL